jgi:aminoglycoside phosphotransferase (APT) family kinase protein
MVDADGPDAKIRRWIEQDLKANVLSMERQARWRPAWFVEAETAQGKLPLYVRGRREQAELLFFPLAHEAEVLRVLHAAGIPSPRIYGLCEDPEAIVMDRMRGRPDLATADSKEEAAAALLDFIPILARMHALPTEDFLKAPGLKMPRNAREIAFTMFDHFETIYRAAKRGPQPEVEFAMGWVRRNVPTHRTRPAFITCDSGQFLFENGRVTSVLDMELAHIGDPALDLASLMLRDMSEPLGDLTPAFRLYEELTGEPIDWGVIRYYIALWGIMTPMVTAHLNDEPPPELNLPYNLDQAITLTRIPMEAIAEALDVELEPMPAPIIRAGSGGSTARQAALKSIMGALADIRPADSFQLYRHDSAQTLANYLGILIEHEPAVLEEERTEAAALLGRDIPDERERNAALEAFVLAAGPEHDRALVRLFYRRSARREALLGPTPKLFKRRGIQHPERVLGGG